MYYKMNEDFLAHYGIKGMRWGHHKYTLDENIDVAKAALQESTGLGYGGLTEAEKKEKKKKNRRLIEDANTEKQRRDEDLAVRKKREDEDIARAEYGIEKTSGEMVNEFIEDAVTNTARTLQDFGKSVGRAVEDAVDWITGFFNKS